MTQQNVQIESRCHTCGIRARAEKRPGSLFAGLWRWHTGWCPGWKKYINSLPDDQRRDLAARYGGDEFVLILPETSRNGATVTAERLRAE